MTGNAKAQENNRDFIDIGEIFGIMWRGKWVIFVFALLAGFVAAFYVTNFVTPLYRATSVVIMETQQESIIDLQSVVGGFSGDTSAVNSEVEVLQSRSLMNSVVARLNLVEDPEFNSSLVTPSFVEKTVGALRELIVSQPQASTMTPEEQAQRTKDSVTSALLNSVTVRNIPLSLVLKITATSKSSRKAALIADTIAEVYILNQIATKFEATELATRWLTDRVTTLQDKLEEADGKVAEFSAGTDLVSIEGLRALERQAKELRERITVANQNALEAEQYFDALSVLTTREEKAARVDDRALRDILISVQTDPSNEPLFDQRFEQIFQRAELEKGRALQQTQALTKSLEEIDQQIVTQNQDLIQLQQLQREAEANRLLYEYFLARLNETSAQEGIQKADSRKISDAVVPTRASEPRKVRFVLTAIFLSMFLSGSWLLFRESQKNTFRTARILEQATGKVVLGQIPKIPAQNRRHLLNYLTQKPTSAAAEAIRNLRTSILLSNVDNPPQVIISTSSVPGEGKTTSSLALAHSLIGLGKKVLLVEGDIRRRTFNEYFDNIPSKGFISVLSGDAELKDVIFNPKNIGADLLIGEKSSVNAADIFASEKFKSMLNELRGRYDVIIIDTPPVLVVPDALIIAEFADAVLFTVKWDVTTETQVTESMRIFANADLNVTGLILTQIDPKGMKRYGYDGEYGGYGGKYYDS